MHQGAGRGSVLTRGRGSPYLFAPPHAVHARKHARTRQRRQPGGSDLGEFVIGLGAVVAAHDEIIVAVLLARGSRDQHDRGHNLNHPAFRRLADDHGLRACRFVTLRTQRSEPGRRLPKRRGGEDEE